MLNKIIKFSLDNRLIVMIAALLIVAGGCWVTSTMEVDVFPDLNAPTVVVMTEAKGMAPEEVEQLVTFPVESSLNGAAGVRRVRSSSTTGFSVVWVEFDWGTDIYHARQVVSEKLSEAARQLPPQAGMPTLGPQSSILGEVLFVGLTANPDSTSMEQLRTLADWVVRPRLMSTGGVAQVAVLGGDVREYRVMLDTDRMHNMGVALDEVIEATENMNSNATGGILYEYTNEYIIRAILSTSKTDELANTLVKTDDKGNPVLLRDIADISVGPMIPKTGVASVAGKEAVVLTVTKQPDVGTIDLTRNLDKAIAGLRSELPTDVHINTDLYRQEHFINASIDNIQQALIEGAIFVVIILFIFLMNPRTTLISLVTIPMSLLVTILVLKLMNLSINTMSIGGIAIAIGSLVDDAIVDVENVYKRLRENRNLPEAEQLPPIKVIFNASKEVRMPILNSTLIIVVSFLPLFFLQGMEGRMLVPLGVSFIVSLFASTLVALTLTPVLCSYLLAKAHKQKGEPKPVQWMKHGYSVALKWALSHNIAVISVIGVLFALAIVLACGFGRTFLPPFNEGSFTINVSTLPGISLQESDAIGRQAEQILMSIPEIQSVARKTGRAELDEHALGINVSEIEAPFKLDSRTKEEVMHDIRDKMKVIPGINLEIGQPISHRIDAMLSGTQSNIAIKIFGTDLNRMYRIGNQIKNEISQIDGLADINVEQQIERPQLKITPKRDMLARYGITLPQFARYVSTMLGSESVSQVFEGNRAFNLTLRVNENQRAGIDQIRQMKIMTASGQTIPLQYVADVISTSGPNTINRENVERKLVVSANVTNGDLRSAVNSIKEKVDAKIKLPENYHIEYGGQFESEESASRTLLLTSLFSILAIYMLLYNQFRRPLQAAVIMLNLPLALIGGIYAIAISSSIISIPAIIGFISLFGIATRNGMLLVDRYNDLVAQGTPLHQAVVKGSLDRLNPIIMTALTSALALIPLAAGGALPGNEIQSPMAKVILGGLISSTLLNAFIIPIMYIFLNRKRHTTNDK